MRLAYPKYIFHYKSGKKETGYLLMETPFTYFVQFGLLLSGSIYKNDIGLVTDMDGKVVR